MKYKVGDKVKFKPNNGGYVHIEDRGVIKRVLCDELYMVECIHTNESTRPNYHQILSFSEEEIENYA